MGAETIHEETIAASGESGGRWKNKEKVRKILKNRSYTRFICCLFKHRKLKLQDQLTELATSEELKLKFKSSNAAKADIYALS